MCHFITATIPASSRVDDLNKLAENHKLRFYVIHNRFVEEQLPKGLVYLSKAAPRCDCGTVLGSVRSSSINTEQDQTQLYGDIGNVLSPTEVFHEPVA